VLALCACGEEPAPVPTRDAGMTAGGSARRDAGAGDAGTGGGSARDAGGGGSSGGGLPGPNVPPDVAAAITAPVTSGYAGQLFALSLSATDANLDRLSFTWSQVSPTGAQGTFVENGSPEAQRWFSPETLTPTTFVLRVSVTDGRSPAVTREVTVTVRPPRFTEVYANVLGLGVFSGGQCTGCHGSMGNYSVGASANAAWTRLVNVPHTQAASCRAQGLTVLVSPGNPDASLLYRKMAGTQPMECGDVMPRGTTATPPSPPNQVVAVGTWIRLGAPND
jgi:hypothetical protein